MLAINNWSHLSSYQRRDSPEAVQFADYGKAVQSIRPGSIARSRAVAWYNWAHV